MSFINPHLKELLVCPLCHGELDADEANAQLSCCSCGRTYPVRDFPIMMPQLQTEPQAEDQEGELAGESVSTPHLI